MNLPTHASLHLHPTYPVEVSNVSKSCCSLKGCQRPALTAAPSHPVHRCYTLSVDLTAVCDASRGSRFNPSPNDPMLTRCNCPSPTGTWVPCNTLDFTQSGAVFLDVRVRQECCDGMGTRLGSLQRMMPTCPKPHTAAPLAH